MVQERAVMYEDFIVYDGGCAACMDFKRAYRFPNGYGASVICNEFSYGGEDGLYELAVLRFDGDDSELCYDTPITNDVVGWLEWDGVESVLGQVMAL